MTDIAVEPVSNTDNEIPPPIGELVGQLIANMRAYLAAETSVYRAQAAVAGRSVGRIAAYAVVALVLVLGLITALVVGSLLLLAPVIGIGWATLVVVVVLAVLIGIMASLARQQIAVIGVNWNRRNA